MFIANHKLQNCVSPSAAVLNLWVATPLMATQPFHRISCVSRIYITMRNSSKITVKSSNQNNYGQGSHGSFHSISWSILLPLFNPVDLWFLGVNMHVVCTEKLNEGFLFEAFFFQHCSQHGNAHLWDSFKYFGFTIKPYVPWCWWLHRPSFVITTPIPGTVYGTQRRLGTCLVSGWVRTPSKKRGNRETSMLLKVCAWKHQGNALPFICTYRNWYIRPGKGLGWVISL